MSEEWKPIKELNGEYAVSNKGRIKRIPYIDKAGKQRYERIIHPYYSDERHCCIFKVEGYKKKWLVKRLVAEYFLPNPDNLRFLRFKDGDFMNAAVDNLYWADKVVKRDEFSKRFKNWGFGGEKEKKNEKETICD